MSSSVDTKHPRTLVRADLRESVYQNLPKYSRSQITKLVDDVFEEITLAFLEGENVKLRGFGTFKVRNKKQRIGRNPKNGVEAVITPRKVVKFYASQHLVAFINNIDCHEQTNEEDIS